MVPLIESLSPCYWSLDNPNGYTAFFRTKRRRTEAHAEQFYGAIIDLIEGDPRFAEFRVGMSRGELTMEVDLFGRITFPPVGSAANDAMRDLRGRGELGEGGRTSQSTGTA